MFRSLSDTELTVRVDALAQSERDCGVELIASLEEFDRRQLYLPAGYRSLYMYCTQRLRMGEGAAYARIEAARAARRFPVVLERLADGSITLATIGLVARHLTAANHLSLLEETRHRTKRDVERIVAGLRPKPDVPTKIRRMPAISQQEEVAARAHGLGDSTPGPAFALVQPLSSTAPVAFRPALAPLTSDRFKLQITIDLATHDTLREVQDLMRHTVPNGDPAIIVSRALKLLRDELLRSKAAQVRRPKSVARQGVAIVQPRDSDDVPPRSRHVPAEVQRAVWARDGGRCSFIGTDGRCAERGSLEFHHVEPFASGGPSTETNIELRCRAHNAHEAQLAFGPGHRRRRPA
jgi:hypothetical protein